MQLELSANEFRTSMFIIVFGLYRSDQPVRGQNTGAKYPEKLLLACCNRMQVTNVIRTSQGTVWGVNKAGGINPAGMKLPANAFTTIESGWLVARERKGTKVGTKSVPSGFPVAQTWSSGGCVAV